MIVVLDSGPLGLITNPRGDGQAAACGAWVVDMQAHGHTIAVPEIADYEVRRELIRAGLQAAIERLDALEASADVRYLPIQTDVLHRAATLWAEARNGGFATADDSSLDGDVILAAQAQVIAEGREVVVATGNVGDLRRFVDARKWDEIAP